MEKIIVALLLVVVSFSVDVSSRRYSPQNYYRYTPQQKFYFSNVFRQDGVDGNEEVGSHEENNFSTGETISAAIPEAESAVLPTENKIPEDLSNEPVACTEPGFFKKNCVQFFRCVNMSENGGPPFISYEFDCPSGSVFNTKIGICDHEYNVPECKGQSIIPGAGSGEEDDDSTEISEIDSKEKGDPDSKEKDDDDSEENDDRKTPGVFSLVCYDDKRYIQHPLYCNKYFICFQDDIGIWEVSSYQCPPELIFNEDGQICKLPGREDESCQIAPSAPVDKPTGTPEEVPSITDVGTAETVDSAITAESNTGQLIPIEGEVAPIEEAAVPSEGELAPIEEAAVPSEGGVAPIEETAVPSEGEVTPIEEGEIAPIEEAGAAPLEGIANRRVSTSNIRIPPRIQNLRVEPDSPFACPKPGFYPYEDDCVHFYKCVVTRKNSLTALLYVCPRGYGYSEEAVACVGKEKMKACTRMPEATSITQYIPATPVYDNDLLWFFNE